MRPVEAEVPGGLMLMRDGVARCQTWCHVMPSCGPHGVQCPEPATHDQSTKCQHHSAAATQQRAKRVEDAGRA